MHFLCNTKPTSRPSLLVISSVALVAQSVEHFLGKEEVTGSIPVEGSRIVEQATTIGALIR